MLSHGYHWIHTGGSFWGFPLGLILGTLIGGSDIRFSFWRNLFQNMGSLYTYSEEMYLWPQHVRGPFGNSALDYFQISSLSSFKELNLGSQSHASA